VCDVVLPFSGLSKVHAAVTMVPGAAALIEDIGSTNGTNVEGTRLGKGVRATLVDGTRIRFGDVHATFYSPRAFALMLRHKSR
jgi:pSer/pThr/pTyr-binding forkhead associated (FHA) protein